LAHNTFFTAVANFGVFLIVCFESTNKLSEPKSSLKQQNQFGATLMQGSISPRLTKLRTNFICPQNSQPLLLICMTQACPFYQKLGQKPGSVPACSLSLMRRLFGRRKLAN
jgi:hypothetical protein